MCDDQDYLIIWTKIVIIYDQKKKIVLNEIYVVPAGPVAFV